FDFNGDGTNDILIGAEQVDRTGAPVATGAGKAYLIYFDPTDTTHYPNFDADGTADKVSLSLVGGGIPGVVFTGVSMGDQAGYSVAGGGRINADARRDLAIGAPGKDVGVNGNAGAVYVAFSPASPLSGTISLSQVADTDGTNDLDGIRYEGKSTGDALG